MEKENEVQTNEQVENLASKKEEKIVVDTPKVETETVEVDVKENQDKTKIENENQNKKEEEKVNDDKKEYLEQKEKQREEDLKNYNKEFEARRLAKARDAMENTLNYYKMQLKSAESPEMKRDLEAKISQLNLNEKKIEETMAKMKKGKNVDFQKLLKSIKDCDKIIYTTDYVTYDEGFDIDQEVRDEMTSSVGEMDTTSVKDNHSYKPPFRKNREAVNEKFRHNGGRPQEELENEDYYEDMPQFRNITFDEILKASTSKSRKELLLGLTHKEKLNLLENVSKTKLEARKEKPLINGGIPGLLTYTSAPRYLVEEKAEQNKMLLKEYVQEHLVYAKAQSDLILKGLAKDLEGIEINDESMYGVEKVKFTKQSTVDKDKMTDEVNYSDAFKRGLKYYSKEAWRYLIASPRVTSTIRVTKPKPGFEDIAKEDLKDNQKQVDIYKYDVYNTKYSSDKALNAYKEDPYEKMYEKYAKKQEKLQSQNPPRDLEGKELEFVKIYKQYRGNLECAKEMEDIYKVYEERHPLHTLKQEQKAKNEIKRQKNLVDAGVKNVYIEPKTYAQSLREALRKKVISEEEKINTNQYQNKYEQNKQKEEDHIR